MTIRTVLTDRLGIDHPIIQAPMAGGATTPALVAAVCEAGALGSFAAGLLSPPRIAEGIAEIRRRTRRPFAVNLFTTADDAGAGLSPARIAAAQARLAPYRRELGLPEPPPPARYAEDLAAQLDAVLTAAPAVFSFTFGLPPDGVLAECRRRGIFTIGTATTVAEGRALAAAGADAVCAQGAEAGGHRGTFLGPPEDAMIGMMALVRKLACRLAVPVIAAGGIMDGSGIAAALALGAAGAQLGTAFLACHEAGIPEAYRRALLAAGEHGTAITRAFTGRPARGLRNRFLDEMAPFEAELPPYPVQNVLTRDIRQAAAAAGRAEFLSLWAGQGAPLARPLPAAELVARLAEETSATIDRLAAAAGTEPRR